MLQNDYEDSLGSGVEMKSSSLPNMVDSLAEADDKGGKGMSKSTGESTEALEPDLAAKVRYTISTNKDLLKFRLPKLSKASDKGRLAGFFHFHRHLLRQATKATLGWLLMLFKEKFISESSLSQTSIFYSI